MFGPSVANALTHGRPACGFTLQLPEQQKPEVKQGRRQLSAALAGVSSLPLGVLAHPTFAPTGSSQTWHSLHALNRAETRKNGGEEVIPSALRVGQAAERHIVGESDPVVAPGICSQPTEGDGPAWRHTRCEPKLDTDAEIVDVVAARIRPSPLPVAFDPDPNADWDFDFSGDGRPFRFARGKVSRARGSGKDGLRVARAQLRGEEPMQLAERDADGLIRHVGPTSPFGGLGECGNPFCGAHRLFNPNVRSHFRDFVVDWVCRAVDRNLGNCREDGLRYTSIGSGELFFDNELLERIRSVGVRISQVCVVDRQYRQPSMTVRRALREFADWQRASAHLDKQKPAEIFAFGHIEDCAQSTTKGKGSHLIVHCDSHWDHFFHDCEELALRALGPEGLMARLNPRSLLVEMQDSGSQSQEAKLHHSKAVFSVAAWTRIPGKTPLLKELRDFSLEACVAAISCANSTPLDDDIRAARDRAQNNARTKAQTRAKAQEVEKHKQEMLQRADQLHEQATSGEQTQAQIQAAALKQKMNQLMSKRDDIVRARVDREDEAASLKDPSRKLELIRRGFTVWRVVYDPQVAVRALPRISANRVGVLFKGEEVICSSETEHNGWIQIAEGPARAKLPPEAWVCFDPSNEGYGVMLEQVQVSGTTTAAAA